MKRILFVCTGNICRSPMAEGLFRNRIIKMDKRNNYEARSAGIYAQSSELASEYAVEALKQLDVDITTHRARRVSYELMKESDIVIGMTGGHKRELLERFPEFEDRIFTLYEFISEDRNRNVDDPYGMSLDIYVSCAGELREAIDKLIEKLD